MRQFIFLILGIGLFVQSYAQPATNENELDAVFQQAKSINTIRAVLIQQNGELLGEAYFRSASPDYPYNIKSASKSIISLLVGIAADQDKISLNDRLGDYFPEYFKENPHPEKENITVRNLLSMQSGLETTSFHNYGRWVISDNWAEFQLNQPLIEEPGGKMTYSTGISHLLSVIISKATEMSTRAFANKYLFEPMDIHIGGWDRDPQGYYMGGNNLAMTPKDLLKIGQMILNGGIWKNQRIVSKEWVHDSFQTYTRSNFNPYDYGYMWWNRPVGEFDVYFAWGFGGQYLFMIPELNAVTVITSFLENATQRRTYKEPIFDLLKDDIIPFLEQNYPNLTDD
ncbi:MAG: serine hydrolase [Balneolaceae bacterium]